MATFWSEKQNIIEPKRKYRFTVEIAAFGGGLGPNSGTSVVWFAKSAEWNEISVKMVDPVDPDAVFLTHQIILNSGYAVPASSAGTYATMSKKKAATGANIQGVILTQLDANGHPLEKWTLNNPFVTGVEFGEFVYEGDDLREIDLKFRYDWATCQKWRDGQQVEEFDPRMGGIFPN